MSDPNFFLFYVESPARSVAFYRELWGRDPVNTSPNFAMFVFDNGCRVGLWARADATPAPQAAPGGSELIAYAASRGEARALYERWRSLGLPIAQEPTEMEFGYTFVGLDPDGHRLRAIAPAGA